MRPGIIARAVLCAALLVLALAPALRAEVTNSVIRAWKSEFPKLDVTKRAVKLDEIFDVLHRDSIPAIDEPKYVPLSELRKVADDEPVIGLVIGAEARAYPLQVMTWHEIVNDTVGGVPVSVTYCPLCNSSVVFDRRVGGQVLSFGVSGRLRHSDLVMYDRETETWWQQFTGEGIVGTHTGVRLKQIPARLESLAQFRKRAPNGLVLVPKNPAMRPYGQNPYPYYDSSKKPTSYYQGPMPQGIAPLARVVVVGREAWSFDLVREKKRVESGDLVLTWERGQLSALDAVMISTAKDVGTVLVQRKTKDGLKDEPYMVSFAFAFHALVPGGVLNSR
jgi:hypothetical protein